MNKYQKELNKTSKLQCKIFNFPLINMNLAKKILRQSAKENKWSISTFISYRKFLKQTFGGGNIND